MWDQDAWHRMLEEQTSLGGMARGWAHATWSCFGLMGPLMCFFLSYYFFGKNIDARKILAPLEFRKVPKT
jgi:hypothetical protein